MKRIMKEQTLGRQRALVGLPGGGEVYAGARETYRQMMLKMIISGQMVMMLAMPRAKQRIMQRMPSL